MRYFLLVVFLGGWILTAKADSGSKSEAAKDYEISKVNHELIDKDGYTTIEIGDWVKKAQYQKSLFSNKDVKGMRFIVHWKALSSENRRFTVKLQVRGYDGTADQDTFVTLFKNYSETPSHSGWTFLDLKGKDWQHLGTLMAWKASLLENYKVVAERHSFTWDDTLLTSQTPNETK